MSSPKRVLVLQHVAVEHPGIFKTFFAEDGYEYVPIELDEGEAIPALDEFAALWVMGGPMDVWQEDEHPWLKTEKAVIAEAVLTRKMPYLGFCLGHQLLASALGGEVGLAKQAEVGVKRVTCLAAGEHSAFLRGLPHELEVLQWHGAEVTHAPPGAQVLATSPLCANQAMSIGTHAFSIQFHVEITTTMVSDWSGIPAYRCSLEESLGAGGADLLIADMQQRMPTFNAYARQLYRNWKASVGW